MDFIFGGATAWFERCRIHCRRDGYITAASTPENAAHGFVFSRCRVTGEPGAKTYLGRPWRAYSAVAYVETDMSEVVRGEGWDNWKLPEREKTARYREYRNTGAGGKAESRVGWSRQLTAPEAERLTVAAVLGGTDGWNPASVGATAR